MISLLVINGCLEEKKITNKEETTKGDYFIEDVDIELGNNRLLKVSISNLKELTKEQGECLIAFGEKKVEEGEREMIYYRNNRLIDGDTGNSIDCENRTYFDCECIADELLTRISFPEEAIGKIYAYGSKEKIDINGIDRYKCEEKFYDYGFVECFMTISEVEDCDIQKCGDVKF